MNPQQELDVSDLIEALSQQRNAAMHEAALGQALTAKMRREAIAAATKIADLEAQIAAEHAGKDNGRTE